MSYVIWTSTCRTSQGGWAGGRARSLRARGRGSWDDGPCHCLCLCSWMWLGIAEPSNSCLDLEGESNLRCSHGDGGCGSGQDGGRGMLDAALGRA